MAKRPVKTVDLERLAEDVEREACERGHVEIASRTIGELVLPRLRTLDEISYVRFASIYRDFRDVEEFRRELERLEK